MPSRTTVSWLNLSQLVEDLLQVVEGAYWRVMRSIVGNHHEVAFDSFFPVATNFGHSSPVRSITTLLLSMSVFVAIAVLM